MSGGRANRLAQVTEISSASPGHPPVSTKRSRAAPLPLDAPNPVAPIRSLNSTEPNASTQRRDVFVLPYGFAPRKASISPTSSGESRNSSAAANPSTCDGRRAPTIAPVTSGLRSTQASATTAAG